MPKLTISAYARHRGVTRHAVQKAIASGRISRGRDGLVDSEKADRSWKLRTQVQAKPVDRRPAEARNHEPDVTGEALQRARAVRENFNARLAELEFQKRSAQLVPVEDVRRAAFDAARRVRNLIGNMGDRIGPVVVGLSVHETITIINDEVNRVLDELSQPSKNGKGD